MVILVVVVRWVENKDKSHHQKALQADHGQGDREISGSGPAGEGQQCLGNKNGFDPGDGLSPNL